MHTFPTYQFHSQLLLRTPAYASNKYREADLQYLLRDPYFKAAVQLASKALYHELEKKQFEVKLLSPNMVHALRKYLNRMCFRPTPFGLFSGFSLVNWASEKKKPLLLHRECLKVHTAPGFGDVLKFARELVTHELASSHTYRRNASLYKVPEEYRYLRYEQDAGKPARIFFIDALNYQGFLNSVLQFCDSEKSKAAVIAFITKRASATAAESEAFFEQLVEQQLLVSTLEANITGENYLHRLLDRCRSLQLNTDRIRNLEVLLKKLKATAGAAGSAKAGSAILSLDHTFQHLGKARSALYVNLDKGAAIGGFSQKYQQDILEGIACLIKLVPASTPPGLQRFRNAFQGKFGNRSIPLLTALDPELGIGYEELAGSYRMPMLLRDMAFPTVGAESTTLAWTPAHALLLEKWSKPEGAGTVVQLTDADLESLTPTADPTVLPPSISVLFRVMDDTVFIEQAGGASATALLGRFTPLHPEIEQMAKAVAQQEAAANPDVIFAEIAHICDGHTANIDCRSAIRSFEIPVLVQSTLPPEQQIPLSDLRVKVEADQVVLYSEKHQKVIVPRLGSAFNYLRDDLSVFRFLCDLQYQGIQANFTLDLSHFFPGMSYYPRVVYKAAVLHLATWHLKRVRFLSILEASAEQAHALLKAFGAALGWPRYIALTEHDNQLVFDLEQEADLGLFLHTIRHKETVMVREFPFMEEQTPAVTDETGKPYIHQFLAALYHGQEVYPKRELKEKSLPKLQEEKRKLLPGSEWLYFKIYCHPSRSNQLLGDVLLPAIKHLMSKEYVRQWFYVRYRDPEYHVRVRFSVAPENAGKVLQIISQKLARHVRKGVEADFQVAIYERELERYGPELIEAVEDVFCASSELVAASIRKPALNESDYGYYKAAFSGLNEITNAFKVSLAEKVPFFQQLYQAFYLEFSGDKALREQLSLKFREVSKLAGMLPHHTRTGAPEDRSFKRLNDRYSASLQAMAQQVVVPAQRQQLMADIMHMHLNRLFVDQARKQELVVYYCLWKSFASALAQDKR